MPSVEALAIGSLTAPNLKLCRPSRSATLAARTTWPTAPWTSEPSVFLLPESRVPGHQPCAHQPSRQEASLLGPAGLGNPRTLRITIFVLFSAAIKAQSFFLDQIFLSLSLSPSCPSVLHKPLPPVPPEARHLHLPELPAPYRTDSLAGIPIWAQGIWSECPVTQESPLGVTGKWSCVPGVPAL